MAMVTGYFDDSGHPDQGLALVVAGYVSTVENWQLFECQWKSVLSEYEVSVFHMKEFAHSVGEFKAWKNDTRRRREFLTKLANVIAKWACKSISSVILLEEYSKADQQFHLHEWAPPYAFCGASCAAKAKRWADKRKHEGMEYVFEDGTKDRGKLMELMKLEGYPPPIFKEKGSFGALQAADFVAWEHLKHVTGVEKGILSKFRKSFDLLRKVSHDWSIVPHGHLQRSCQKVGVPRRNI